ncbi:MAG: hypothetical protein ACI808_000789 [Paraglaciecola sp.]|jgi:hypothetical protein
MKNILLKTCLTGLALSVAGLANAQEEPVTIFTPQLISHAAISGAALSIAADSFVDGNLAAQAAIAIGAGDTYTQNIYSGAAITTGASSNVKNIYSGAAAGIGAGAYAQNIDSAAAVAVGANGAVQMVNAGAAITLAAGASMTNEQPWIGAEGDGDIYNTDSMTDAMSQIKKAQTALFTLNKTDNTTLLNTTMGSESLIPGVWQGSALTIAAQSLITFDAAGEVNPVWIINLSAALTVGAGTEFIVDNLGPDGKATIIWNVGAAVTLGAGTSFLGSAFVNGAFNAATSNVSCGNIYAAAAVSVGSIGAVEVGTSNPLACDTNAEGLAGFRIDDNGYSFPSQPAAAVCPLWTNDELAAIPTNGQSFEYTNDSELKTLVMTANNVGSANDQNASGGESEGENGGTFQLDFRLEAWLYHQVGSDGGTQGGNGGAFITSTDMEGYTTTDFADESFNRTDAEACYASLYNEIISRGFVIETD